MALKRFVEDMGIHSMLKHMCLGIECSMYYRTSEDWRTCTHTSKHLRTIARRPTPENWWTRARTPRHLHTLGHNCEQACIPANMRTNHKRPVGEQACIPLNTCEHTPVSPGVSQNTCDNLRVPLNTGLNTCKHSPITLNTCEQAHIPLYCHRHHIQTYMDSADYRR